MGMPGWAMVLGAPYAIDKLVTDPISSAYGLYKGVRNDQAEQQDRQAGMELLQRFAQDPNSVVDEKAFSKFTNPKAAEDAVNHATGIAKGLLSQQAQPKLNEFAKDLRDPEFQTVEAQNFLAEKAQPWYGGDGRNAVLNSKLIEQGDNARSYADLMESGLTPAMARIATNTKSLPNLSEMQTLRKTTDEVARKGVNLSDFARAQQLAGENLGFIGDGTKPGDYLSAPEIRSMTANDLSRFALSPEERNSINSFVDKGLSDKWIAKKTKTAKGTLTEQVNPYTGEVKEKANNTTIINNQSQKEPKAPVYKRIRADNLKSADGTIGPGVMTFNMSLPEDRAIADKWLRSGQGVEVGMETESTFTEQGTKSRKVAPGGSSIGQPKAETATAKAPKVEESVSKSGKPMIKVNGVLEYK